MIEITDDEDWFHCGVLAFSLEVVRQKNSDIDDRISVDEDFSSPINIKLSETQQMIIDEEPEEIDADVVTPNFSNDHFLQPRRCSMRLAVLEIERQETAMKKKEESKRQKIKKTKERKKHAIQAAKTRKQRNEIEEASQALLRCFRLVGNAKTKNGKRNISVWEDLHLSSCEFLNFISDTKSLEKSKFQIFLVNGCSALKNTMLAARPRTEETHQLMLGFIVSLYKAYDVALRTGVITVGGDLSRLLEQVFGKYLSTPKWMSPTHVPWIQTKNIFKLLLSIIEIPEIIYDLIDLLCKMQINVNRKSLEYKEHDESFKAYAATQINHFYTILANRVMFLDNQQRYSN
ncbi:Double-Strand Break factor [Caenorhabditis elegans]|uniref:Double-Strand Break factor n=1 Tax=Caenorhabditis elegans TaxID=6239 RepID=Q18649_CAEEL|nr:Double-Strand Break factor [Caenorhabditis elegans]CCD66596.1 Double-Strand Break factor [Caenorhabditis elegans]|eukprot:NP_001255306.1 Double-Strand Break factor [Caenorhabditis elegans]